MRLRRAPFVARGTWRALAVTLLLPGALRAESGPPPTSPPPPAETLTGQSTAEDAEGHPEEQVAEARRLYLEGSSRAQLGDWAAALASYEAAFASYPRAATLYNVAYCHAQLGSEALAWQLMARALNHRAFPEGRRLDAERRQSAERLLEEWFAALAVIEIITTRSDVQVRVNGQALAPSEREADLYAARSDSSVDPLLGRRARVVLDPGRHQLRLRTQLTEETLEFDLPPGARVRLTWPAESKVPAPVPDSSGPALRPAHASPSHLESGRTDTSSGRPLRIAGWISLGIAGAGAGVALVSGAVALATGRRLDRACGSETTCPPSSAGLIDRYETSIHWTNLGILTVAGAGAVGAGLLWWDASTATGGLHVAVSPTSVQLSGTY